MLQRFIARGLGATAKNQGGSSIRVFSAIPFILFGCLWAGFGIASFVMIHQWGREYDRKLALIAAGKATPRTLYVVSIRAGDDQEWNVGLSLRRKEKNPRLVEDYERTRALGDLAVGQKITGYQFDKQWFIPRFATGGFNWGQWVFLAFGLGPPLGVGAIAMFVSRRRRARARARQAARAAAPGATPLLPLPFTRDALHFDHAPSDDQLLALLGSYEYTSALDIRETPAALTARPGLLPMRYIVPWMIFTAAVITAMALLFGVHGQGPDNSLIYGVIAALWLLVLPVMFAICAAINRHFAEQKDYFQIDLLTRTLALPRAGVTLRADQIDSLVSVERWFKTPHDSGWIYVAQLAALARCADTGFDYYPLLRDQAKRPFQKPLATRVADALNRPLRTIKRSRHDCKTLADAL